MARSSSRQVSVYTSKIDLWVIVIFVASGMALIAGVVTASISEGALRAAQGGAIALGVIGLLAWVVTGTRYILDGGELLIRSGPVRRRIAIASITSVEPARGFDRLKSSPALSFHRLAVVHDGGKTVLISPNDSDRFLADLRARQNARAMSVAAIGARDP